MNYKYYKDFNKLCDLIVEDLLENKIIGWFQGKSEFGPRALGNRSILANPTLPDNKDYINERVKHREGWRPYAPIMLEEYVHDWYDIPKTSSPYMLFNAWLLPEKKGKVPAVTHVDGSARIQTVTEELNKPIFQLLTKWNEKTNVPILLNTSFNVNAEPIIESPENALRTFMSTNIDVLVMENYIVTK
jgi:carbamoyltransferase